MGALAPSQRPDDGWRWLGVGGAPEEGAVGGSSEAREEHRTTRDRESDRAHAAASAERSRRS